MLCKFENKEGNVTVNEAVVSFAAAEAVKVFSGKVWLSNAKGRLIPQRSRFGSKSEADSVEVSQEAEGIFVRCYVIIRFGTSIRMITEALIAEVKKSVQENTGLEIGCVSIVVTGMISKHIAKRNIEIRG